MEFIEVKGMKDSQAITIQCSKLILGSGNSYRLEKEEFFTLLDEFVRAGGNTLDMAHQYVNAEPTIGEWLKTRNNREQMNILTKGAHPDDGEPGNRVKPDSITHDILDSLKRLDTDYIDLYALHRDDESVEVGPIIDVLNEHIQAGRIRAIGSSNWSLARIKEANAYAEANGLVGFTFNSPNLSLAKVNEVMWDGCVTADDEMIKWHEETQTPLLSWSSLAMGFFTGNFAPEKTDDEDMVRVYYNDTNWNRLAAAEKIAAERNVSPIQLALSYVLNQSFPTSAIVGPLKVNELSSSVEGAKLLLSKEELEQLTTP